MSIDKELVLCDVVGEMLKHPLIKKIIWLPQGPHEMIRLILVLEERKDRTPISWPVCKDGFKFDILCLGESGLTDFLQGNSQLEPNWDFSSQEIFSRPKLCSLALAYA
jgi:hypothetical protein